MGDDVKFTARTNIARLMLPAGKTDVIHFDDTLPGFGLRLRQSGDRIRRSWVYQYRRAGGQRRMSLGNADVVDVAKARPAAVKAAAKVTLGEDPQQDKAEKRERDSHSLKALIRTYLAWKESSGVRPLTLIAIRRYLLGPYFRALHSMPVDRVGRKDVAGRVLAIARENGKVTAARARTALQTMFTWAMQQGLAESNPFVGTAAPKGNPPRERVLDDRELAEVWRAAGDDDFGRVVRLCICTGQRRGEVGSMEWSEIDRDRAVWVIPSSKAKNHKQHAVPLSALALSIIAEVPERVGRAYLFGDRAAGFTTWGVSKRALDQRLAGKVAKWTLHDLRRSAVTRMCDLGVGPHIVEELLNHHSGHRAGIAGVYNRSRYEREVRAAVALWGDHLRSLITGEQRKVVAFINRENA
jgi:integrase